ncbi:hypothetical protein AB8S08_11375 [Pseudidiomarina sp. PP-1MA]|uniref:Uncharacterized protein n=1 Tax=Pseudidiomarina sp. PP-1MA TaxID=3237706 RepID=A0AB39X5P7_9GAMM
MSKRYRVYEFAELRHYVKSGLFPVGAWPRMPSKAKMLESLSSRFNDRLDQICIIELCDDVSELISSRGKHKDIAVEIGVSAVNFVFKGQKAMELFCSYEGLDAGFVVTDIPMRVDAPLFPKEQDEAAEVKAPVGEQLPQSKANSSLFDGTTDEAVLGQSFGGVLLVTRFLTYLYPEFLELYSRLLSHCALAPDDWLRDLTQSPGVDGVLEERADLHGEYLELTKAVINNKRIVDFLSDSRVWATEPKVRAAQEVKKSIELLRNGANEKVYSEYMAKLKASSRFRLYCVVLDYRSDFQEFINDIKLCEILDKKDFLVLGFFFGLRDKYRGCYQEIRKISMFQRDASQAMMVFHWKANGGKDIPSLPNFDLDCFSVLNRIRRLKCGQSERAKGESPI